MILPGAKRRYMFGVASTPLKVWPQAMKTGAATEE